MTDPSPSPSLHIQPRPRKHSLPPLDDILKLNEDQLLVYPGLVEEAEEDASSFSIPSTPKAGFCIECTDQPANVFCENCEEDYCQVCFDLIHRTGKRRQHTRKSKLMSAEELDLADRRSIRSAISTNGTLANLTKTLDEQLNGASLDLKSIIIQNDDRSFGDWIAERTKYIPVRLNLQERKFLRLLEAALNVSEYTDKIDVYFYGSKTKRVVKQIKDICAILLGLVVSCDYKAGQDLVQNKTFSDNAAFFQEIFEIGRRHKIMNPEKMRSAYGKLMYMLQDSVHDEVQETLEFSLVNPIKTVHKFLEDRNSLPLLYDELLFTATKEIVAEGRKRVEIDAEIEQKERAVKILARRYCNSAISMEEISQCLYSIGDNHSYLRANRDPCDRMIALLKKYFHPEKVETGYSLAIQCNKDQARLTHSHDTQFLYVLQTLQLWREILHEMFMLWSLADQDLLSGTNLYRLKDTGQGLQRVQGCPQVSRVIHRILNVAQKRIGFWVGSSVVHLGDKNVPNALIFIDKYNQVPRILAPIVRCIDQLEKSRDTYPDLFKFAITAYGGLDTLIKSILVDFFRHAFDGSGADNFFDAGSCIDGRLTSAWNWCSNIEKKSYFAAFLLTGFVGFDGEGFN